VKFFSSLSSNDLIDCVLLTIKELDFFKNLAIRVWLPSSPLLVLASES
jgi:hypothetical protein